MGNKSAMRKKEYLKEIKRLTVELVKLQEWVKAQGLKVVVIFEGRDAAGKGGVIKSIMSGLNARNARIVALPTPTDKEKTQWYFQRYVAQLPAGGEMVFFDRSWYNRAGVEKVMGFCTDEEYKEFTRTLPEFEWMLQRSGIFLIKYWFSVSDEEQERRFNDRLKDPAKRWKLSPMDMTARSKWVDYSRAKDAMFEFSDTPDSPWNVVDADDKYCARLNVITHLLSRIPYKDLTPEAIKLPPRQKAGNYVRPHIESQHWIPRIYPRTEDLRADNTAEKAAVGPAGEKIPVEENPAAEKITARKEPAAVTEKGNEKDKGKTEKKGKKNTGGKEKKKKH